MSAFATLPRLDRAFLWTDGAISDIGGVLRSVERKAFTVDGQSVAVTGRGPSILSRLLCRHLEHCQITADDIEQHGEELTGAFFNDHAGMISSVAAVDVCIVAWSKAQAAPVIALRTTEPEADGVAYKLGSHFSAPGIDLKEKKRLRLRVGPVAIEDVEPERYGRELVEAQRRTPGAPHLGFAGLFCVGGHILQTEVSAAGVSHQIIHTWPDVIGERINPFG